MSLEAGDLSVIRFLRRIRTRFVEREAIAAVADPRLALFNMNEPADYCRACRMNGGEEGMRAFCRAAHFVPRQKALRPSSALRADPFVIWIALGRIFPVCPYGFRPPR